MKLALLPALVLGLSGAAGAQSIPSEGGYPRDRQMERPERPQRADRAARALERCRAERGVDCDTARGLREWELLERSRQEAVRQGSRHLPPADKR